MHQLLIRTQNTVNINTIWLQQARSYNHLYVSQWVDWKCRTGKWRTKVEQWKMWTGKCRTNEQGWKMQDWNLQDWKMQDRKMYDWNLEDKFTALENAGLRLHCVSEIKNDALNVDRRLWTEPYARLRLLRPDSVGWYKMKCSHITVLTKQQTFFIANLHLLSRKADKFLTNWSSKCNICIHLLTTISRQWDTNGMMSKRHKNN